MKKKLTARQIQTRAKRAEKLMEDKLLLESLEILDKSITDKMAALAPTDVEGLMYLNTHRFIARSFKENLFDIIRDGKKIDFDMAQAENVPPLGDIIEWRRQKKAQ